MTATARRITRSLLAPGEIGTVALALLVVAAMAVGLAGYLHGRLFHEGYSHVSVVGPLFLLNELASGATILLLLARRYALFMLSALGISTGAVASILVSHTTSFFGFAEHAYDARATTIVVSEIAAAALVLVAAAVARRELATVAREAVTA
jgi:hypothetical protein